MEHHPDFDTLCAFSLEELEAKKAEEVSGHAAACPLCRRELEAISLLASGLRALPEIQPDKRSWSSLRSTLEREQAGSIVLSLLLRRVFARPLVFGTLSLLAVSLIVFLVARRQRAAPAESAIGIVEMGSTIAHRSLKDEDPRDVLASYLNDAELIVAEAMHCADSGDAVPWRILKKRIASRDMIYRALYLREKLPDLSAGPETGGVPRVSLGLVDDSSSIIREINERPPEVLARERESVKQSIESARLLDRFRKGENR